MRREILRTIATARAEHVGRDQSGDAGVEMHHRSAGKIQQTRRAEEAAAPDPMRDRHIDDEKPACVNHRKAENRMRSATDPATSATVMTANVI